MTPANGAGAYFIGTVNAKRSSGFTVGIVGDGCAPRAAVKPLFLCIPFRNIK